MGTTCSSDSHPKGTGDVNSSRTLHSLRRSQRKHLTDANGTGASSSSATIDGEANTAERKLELGIVSTEVAEAAPNTMSATPSMPVTRDLTGNELRYDWHESEPLDGQVPMGSRSDPREVDPQPYPRDQLCAQQVVVDEEYRPTIINNSNCSPPSPQHGSVLKPIEHASSQTSDDITKTSIVLLEGMESSRSWSTGARSFACESLNEDRQKGPAMAMSSALPSQFSVAEGAAPEAQLLDGIEGGSVNWSSMDGSSRRESDVWGSKYTIVVSSGVDGAVGNNPLSREHSGGQDLERQRRASHAHSSVAMAEFPSLPEHGDIAELPEGIVFSSKGAKFSRLLNDAKLKAVATVNPLHHSTTFSSLSGGLTHGSSFLTCSAGGEGPNHDARCDQSISLLHASVSLGRKPSCVSFSTGVTVFHDGPLAPTSTPVSGLSCSQPEGANKDDLFYELAVALLEMSGGSDSFADELRCHEDNVGQLSPVQLSAENPSSAGFPDGDEDDAFAHDITHHSTAHLNNSNACSNPHDICVNMSRFFPAPNPLSLDIAADDATRSEGPVTHHYLSRRIEHREASFVVEPLHDVTSPQCNHKQFVTTGRKKQHRCQY